MDLALLWSRCKAGDVTSRGALIERYSGLASRLARRLGPIGLVSREDLESAGLVGLIDAVDRYQPERGVPFEAYAALRVHGAMIDELRADRGRSTDVAVQLSLDELLETGDGALPREDVGATRDANELRYQVERAIRELPDRERALLADYYGRSLTLREVGLRMGISEARVSQLHSRAIAQLRLILLPQRATERAAVSAAA